MNQVSILLIILIFSGFILVLDSTLFPKVFANDGKNITEVNSLEHQEVFATGNSLVLLENSYPNNDIYILAYSDGDTDGFIKTFNISSDGSTITEIAVLEHDTNRGYDNSLLHVDGNIYALAYAGTDDDGFIKTFNISSDGSTITEIAVLEHDIDLAGDNSLVQVDSDTYALAYEGTSNQRGYISTFNISSDGTITAVKTQSLGNNLQHDTRGFENSLVQVDSDTYALAYSGENDDGYISTFTISSNSSSSSSSGGGKNNCDSNGFGKSNSLRVYQVTYNVNTFEVQVQAYSTCGSISTKMTTPSGQSILGLSTEQPLLNDRIVVYSGFLDESDEKFNISIQNKRDSFSETFYIYDKSIAKKYTGDTGYTSEQQGASLPTVTSEQTTVVSEPPVTQIVQTIQDPITVDSQKQIPDEKSDALQVQSIVYTPEPVAEKETKPQCGAGTKLVDGICKIIKPDEPKFCFLFWCW